MNSDIFYVEQDVLCGWAIGGYILFTCNTIYASDILLFSRVILLVGFVFYVIRVIKGVFYTKQD